MSRQKNIMEQIEKLEMENERLRGLEKIFDQGIKKEFGYNTRDLHMIIDFYVRYQRQKASTKVE